MKVINTVINTVMNNVMNAVMNTVMKTVMKNCHEYHYIHIGKLEAKSQFKTQAQNPWKSNPKKRKGNFMNTVINTVMNHESCHESWHESCHKTFHTFCHETKFMSLSLSTTTLVLNLYPNLSFPFLFPIISQSNIRLSNHMIFSSGSTSRNTNLC